jgi:hypothetical protein
MEGNNMKATVGGVEVLSSTQQIFNQAETFSTFKEYAAPAITANTAPVDPNLPIDKMGSLLIDLGQDILLGVSGVVVVVCGILIAVGLKREGWKRVISIIQGLGVGLVGPTVVVLVAGFFAGFAKMLG